MLFFTIACGSTIFSKSNFKFENSVWAHTQSLCSVGLPMRQLNFRFFINRVRKVEYFLRLFLRELDCWAILQGLRAALLWEKADWKNSQKPPNPQESLRLFKPQQKKNWDWQKETLLTFLHFSSVAQSCPTLCDPMDCSTPGPPVHHQLLEFTQTHVHWVDDAIQPSHPLSSPSPPALSFPASGPFPVSQFFTSGGQSIGVSASASVLLMNIQDWFPLGWTGWISLLSKGLSRVFSNTTVQKHQFFSAQPSLWSSSHIHIWLLEKP